MSEQLVPMVVLLALSYIYFVEESMWHVKYPKRIAFIVMMLLATISGLYLFLKDFENEDLLRIQSWTILLFFAILWAPTAKYRYTIIPLLGTFIGACVLLAYYIERVMTDKKDILSLIFAIILVVHTGAMDAGYWYYLAHPSLK